MLNKKEKIFYIHVFECGISSHSGGIICNFFVKNGFEMTSKSSAADIIVINTCGFDQTRENQSFFWINKFSGKSFADKKIIIFGCLTKISSLSRKIKKSKNIILIGPKDFSKFNSLFNAKISIESIDGNQMAGRRWERDGCEENSYYITISQGCVNRCSYCIIKKAKGFVSSEPIKQIVKEFKRGLDLGFKKFVLLADDCGSYGMDIGEDFANLLNKLNKIKGEYKIGIYYFEPQRLKILFPKIEKSVYKKISFICIPLQTTSQRLLVLMNRKYNIKETLEIIKDIKIIAPEIEINTHLLFSYPTETKKDFMMNIILAELGIFNTISFFCYSERKGTLAAKLGNKINLFEKRRRIEIISKISEQSPKCVFNYPRNLKIDGV